MKRLTEYLELAEKPINKLDHPCRQTCSGWKQGFEKGQISGLGPAMARALIMAIEQLEKVSHSPKMSCHSHCVCCDAREALKEIQQILEEGK
jgi:hypothetical protein